MTQWATSVPVSDDDDEWDDWGECSNCQHQGISGTLCCMCEDTGFIHESLGVRRVWQERRQQAQVAATTWRQRVTTGIGRMLRVGKAGNAIPEVGQHCLVLRGDEKKDIGQEAVVTKRDPEKIRSMDAADGCSNGIQNWIVRALEFTDTEIPWAFIKSKTDVNRDDFAFQVCSMQIGKFDELVLLGIKREIRSDESQCLACPDACIGRGWNGIVPVGSFETRLGVLSYPRAGKQPKARPVIETAYSTARKASIPSDWDLTKLSRALNMSMV
jgi:hypothetical protein